MGQLKKIYAALSLQQRILIVAAVLLFTRAMVGLVHWSHERNFKPLFTGMSAEDSASIIQKLKEGGVEHRIGGDGSSVLVPSEKVDELRLEMAGAGLPKTGRIGFELFDRNNLGITDFTEHVNYRRALEGELERSIRVLSAVSQARVHITFPKDSVFLDMREPAKASVLLQTRPGAQLRPQNIVAITNLIANAVEGLTPDAVSVLDMQGNLLSRPPRKHGEEAEISQENLAYRQQLEKDLAAKVESTLEPLLGPGKFRVGLSVDCDFSSAEQSDEVLDPTHSVMVSSQKSEDQSNSTPNAGIPGTPSNLPRAAARPLGAGINSSRRTENVSYETSKSIKRTKTPQGSIKRISASLLLDQEVQWEGKGRDRHRITVPPSAEKLKAINEIVVGVLGIVPERGDHLVVQSLAFEQTLAETAAEESAPKSGNPPASSNEQLNHMLKDRRVLMGTGAAIVLLAAAFAFFFLRHRKRRVELADVPAAIQSAEATPAALDAAQAADQHEQKLLPETEQIEKLRLGLKAHIRKEPELAAEIIRTWLSEGNRPA